MKHGVRREAIGISVSTGRIKVLAEVRLRTQDGDQPVTLLALSGDGALVLSPRAFGVPGECVDLDLPVVGGSTIAVAAGIDSVEELADGHVSRLEFMIIDQSVRDGLDNLLTLLLDGDGGGSRRSPRVRYPVPVRYGESGRPAKLMEISLNGLSMRVAEPLDVGSPVAVELPEPLVLTGSVVNTRASASVQGTFEVGVAFTDLPPKTATALRKLLSQLVHGER